MTILNYEHGDTLVFLAADTLTAPEISAMQRELQRKFPDADVLVLGGITDVKVVRGNR